MRGVVSSLEQVERRLMHKISAAFPSNPRRQVNHVLRGVKMALNIVSPYQQGKSRT